MELFFSNALNIIVGGVVLCIVGILVWAFTRPCGQNASDTEVALLSATGGLAGAGKAAEVAEVVAAETASAEPGEPKTEARPRVCRGAMRHDQLQHHHAGEGRHAYRTRGRPD